MPKRKRLEDTVEAQEEFLKSSYVSGISEADLEDLFAGCDCGEYGSSTSGQPRAFCSGAFLLYRHHNFICLSTAACSDLPPEAQTLVNDLLKVTFIKPAVGSSRSFR